MNQRTEAHRDADRRYNAKRATKPITCHLPAEQAEQFKARCAEDGRSVNAVLTELIRQYMGR